MAGKTVYVDFNKTFADDNPFLINRLIKEKVDNEKLSPQMRYLYALVIEELENEELNEVKVK